MIEQANTFATLVGLLSAFSGSRQAKSTAELSEFMSWLIEHNHSELAKSIEANYATSVSIKALLNQQNAELSRALGELSKTTALIASRMPDLSKIVASIVPDIELSGQSHKILAQMSSGEVEYFLISVTTGGTRLISSNGAKLDYDELLFLHDDLNTLIELGLLRLDYNSQGDEMYYFTRAGAKLGKTSL